MIILLGLAYYQKNGKHIICNDGNTLIDEFFFIYFLNKGLIFAKKRRISSYRPNN